jgi:hypothetical protein
MSAARVLQAGIKAEGQWPKAEGGCSAGVNAMAFGLRPVA